MCLCRWERERGIKVHTRVTPERTSSKEIRLCPSLRSSYRSVMCFLTWEREWQAKKEGRRKGEGRGMEREKHRERKKKSEFHTLIIPLLTQHYWHLPSRLPHSWQGCWQRLPGQRGRSTSCGLLSLLPWHPLLNDWGGGGLSLLATAAETVTQQPDQQQSFFLWESGTLSDIDRECCREIVFITL